MTAPRFNDPDIELAPWRIAARRWEPPPVPPRRHHRLSSDEMSHLNRLARQGWTDDEILAALNDEAVRRAAVGGLANVRKRHANHARAVAECSALISELWADGRKRAACRVLLGLYALARDIGSFSFVTSLRDIGVAGSVGGVNPKPTTIRRGLDYLVSRGLVAEASTLPRDNWSHARTRVRLLTPEGLQKALRTEQDQKRTGGTHYFISTAVDASSGVVVVTFADIGHPLWEERAGLGMSAARTYGCLINCGELVNGTWIAKAIGVHPRTARAAAKTLVAHGLAERHGQGYRAVVRDLDEVLAEIGLADRGAKRVANVAMARRLRAEAIDRLRKGGGTDVSHEQGDADDAAAAAAASVMLGGRYLADVIRLPERPEGDRRACGGPLADVLTLHSKAPSGDAVSGPTQERRVM